MWLTYHGDASIRALETGRQLFQNHSVQFTHIPEKLTLIPQRVIYAWIFH